MAERIEKAIEIIIFASPIYFIMRNDWIGFFINSILYGIAVLFLVTFIGAILAPLPWVLAVGHASWTLRKQLMEEQATIMAKKMAEAMRQQPAMRPPPLP